MAKEWKEFSSTFGQELLTINDTQDCGPARRELANAGIEDGGRLWALCCMNRYFSNPATWDALKDTGAVRLQASRQSRRSPIDTAKCEAALEKAWDSKAPVFGGGRRALTLRAYIDDGGKWVLPAAATNKQRAARDTLCLQLFWKHRPRVQTQTLLDRPSPDAFAALMDAWHTTLTEKVRGFDLYFTKCILDIFMPVSRLPDVVIGWAWPTQCPGYIAAAKVLVPGLPQKEMMKFLLWVHLRPIS